MSVQESYVTRRNNLSLRQLRPSNTMVKEQERVINPLPEKDGAGLEQAPIIFNGW